MDVALWALALGSTLAWAGFDAIRKRLVQRIPVMALSLWVSVAQLPGYAVWTAIEGAGLPAHDYWLPALSSAAMNLFANLLFLEAVRVTALSVAIPILSFTPVFVALFGGPLLGEHLQIRQWCGIFFVTFGAFALTAPAGSVSRPRAIIAAFFAERGVLLMLGVALLWALTPLFDKLALRHASVGLHGLFLAMSVGVGMTMVLAARSQLKESLPPASSLGLLAFGGLVNVLALGLQLVAISAMIVSVFEAFKRAAGLLLAMLFGALFFSERLTAAKLAAGCLMGAGVVLVLL